MEIEECTIDKLIEKLNSLPGDTSIYVADETIDNSDNRVILEYDGRELDIFSSEYTKRRSLNATNSVELEPSGEVRAMSEAFPWPVYIERNRTG
jgi:hypothetical protein